MPNYNHPRTLPVDAIYMIQCLVYDDNPESPKPFCGHMSFQRMQSSGLYLSNPYMKILGNISDKDSKINVKNSLTKIPK